MLRRHGTVWLLALVVLAFPASAGAAITGALKQGACLGGAGCAAIVPAMATAGEPSFSSDGRFLYVPTRGSNSLLTFERDVNSGALTLRSCITFAAVNGCTRSTLPALQDAIGTAVSPDGQTLYVAGSNEQGAPGGVAWYPLDGGLPTVTGSGCAAAAGCTFNGAVGVNGATSVAVSHDGNFVYAASLSGSSVAELIRDQATGALSQASIPAGAKCFSSLGGSCTAAPQIVAPRDIEVTPDDSEIITGSAGCTTTTCGALVALDRNPVTNLIVGVHAGKAGCISNIAGSANCTVDANVDPDQIAITPDGSQIYAPGRSTNSLAVVNRSASGSLSVLASAKPSSLNEPFDVALSPDGGSLYVGSLTGQRIGVFDRSASGTFAPKGAPFGCIAVAPANCGGTPFAQGTAVEYVIPSPDGRQVYAMNGPRIWIFDVDHPPVCASTPINVPFNTAVSIQLRCSDPDGDAVSGYKLLSSPTRGVAILNGDVVNYGPLTGISGGDSFTFQATAAGVSADPATVSLSIGPPVFTAPSCLDNDHDGFCAGQDCNDNSAAIRPGAREIPGNLIDENCDGLVAPFPTLTTPISASWKVRGTRVSITALALRNPLPKGFKAELRCSGKGCPFKSKKLTGKAKHGSLDAFKALGTHTRFRAGEVLEVRVSAPSYNTKVLRFTLKKGKVPNGVPYCLPPGVTKLQKSCG